MENDPSQCFFTGAESRIRAGTGAPFARKEQHPCRSGNEHLAMTLLLTSGSNHTRRGGANQNDHRPHPTGGEGDKACDDGITTAGPTKKTTGPTPQGGGTRPNKTRRESNKAKQDNYPLDRQGGIPWGGGRGGVAALHHICISSLVRST